MLKQLTPIPRILGGILIGFFAIFLVRVTYPLADAILNLWTETSQMRVVAILVMWLVYFFLLWVFVWAYMFQKSDKEAHT